MCECVKAYLNIPHPKLRKPCLYKSERGKEREGEGSRNLTKVLDREEEEEEGGGVKEDSKISLLCSCYHGNPADNTYSLCHSGMEESNESIPPTTLNYWHKNPHSLCQNHSGLPLLFPVRDPHPALRNKYSVENLNGNQMDLV